MEQKIDMQPYWRTLTFFCPELQPVWTATDGTKWPNAGAALYHDLLGRKCAELLEGLRDHRELARYRRQFDLTQAELAQQAGVSRTLVAMVEAGTRRMTDQVAEALWGVLWRCYQEQKEQPSKDVLVRLDGMTTIITEITRLRGKE